MDNKAHDKFFNEVKEMIVNREYNDEVVDKLINIVAVSQILADKERNQKTKRLLLYISIVGEALINKLYELKDK